MTESVGLIDSQGRHWRVFERDGGSISVYYTRPDVGAHFVVFDTLDASDYLGNKIAELDTQLTSLQAENERLKVILAESIRAISFDQLCRYLELDPAEYTSLAKVDDIRQRIIEEARAALAKSVL